MIRLITISPIKTLPYFLFLSIKLKPRVKKEQHGIYCRIHLKRLRKLLPSKTRTTALCAPQPRHSTPRNFLLGQVSIKSSIFMHEFYDNGIIMMKFCSGILMGEEAVFFISKDP
jgi:hypothetical protein